MPKMSNRRSLRQDCARATVPNMSTAPRKVSFEASEDEGNSSSSSVCSLPKVQLSPRRSPPPSPSSIHGRRRETLKRPMPSVCLSSLAMTPHPSPVQTSGEESSPQSTMSDDSCFSWGQFVDVIPPSTSEEQKTDTTYNTASCSDFSRNAYQPYSLNKIKSCHPLKRHKKRKGFLPGFILTIPSPSLSNEKEPMTNNIAATTSHDASDVVLAMKKMRF